MGNYVTICESFQIILSGGGTVVDFCGKILKLGRWNLQMSRCPRVSPGSTPRMDVDKCIIFFLGAL